MSLFQTWRPYSNIASFICLLKLYFFGIHIGFNDMGIYTVRQYKLVNREKFCDTVRRIYTLMSLGVSCHYR